MIATIVVVAVLLASGWLRDRFLAPATVTVFAGLLVLWSAPRIGPIAWSLLNERPAPVQSPTLVTVDAVLSFAIAAAMLVPSVRRRSWVSIDTVWLALVVSTLVAHPGILIPSEWRSGTLFFLALIYAPAYRFLFDATSLNERREDHAARVVRAAGVSALLLTVTMFGVAEDQVGPGLASPLDLFLKDAGRLFLAVPVAVVLVLASRGSDTTDRPPPARAVDVAPTDARLEP